jgi:hypothetical protein
MATNASKAAKASKAVRSDVVRLQNASLEKALQAVTRATSTGTPVKFVGQSRQMKLRSS